MKYLFANWKMYLDFDESCMLASQVREWLYDSDAVTLALFPASIAAREVGMIVAGTDIQLGAQNVAWVPKGAYTGAVSALMYKGIGCTYALVGHSERRHIFGESDTDVRKKVEACLDAGIVPVVCIGETKEEKEEGKREYRLKKQLLKIFKDLDLGGRKIIIAYEPVWSIGTGDACLPADAEDIHLWIRTEIKQYTDSEVPILYGGSVNAENVVSYLSRTAIDGVLVGSMSAKEETFRTLIEVVQREC